MTARPRIDDQQRRARLATRHLLAPAHRADSPEQVVEALVALHATDPATVFLSTTARLASPEPAELDRALYQDRTLLRMHGMRHTLFVVPAELAPALYASTTRKVAEKERRGLLAFAAEGGFDADWLAEVQRRTLAALATAGQATGSQLGNLVPELRESITVAVGKPYEARQAVGVRLLRVLGMENEIVRGRPVGGWTSGQHRWEVRAPLPDVPQAEAQAELVRRWLTAFGPATTEDIRWWTGWGVREVRAAVAGCAAVAVDLDCGPGHALPDDLAPLPEPAPWAALLPSLDPTPMGWQQRDWYLPAAHRAELVDRSGNIGPTVWWNGRVVGGWAQHPDGHLRWEALEPLPGEAAAAIDAEADRLTGWLGGTRVTPRFRTPLERRLGS
ncbi:winged helix DNA-binding domain-containing protein [Kitasatospora sp. CMC57]|uniref:Winged helix DNA-binding domain-containing protein n=1 Tax=Kitasatospora sp. CMC57 TaxID=3231513 RepID=A0AB33JWJ9_9ACTN